MVTEYLTSSVQHRSKVELARVDCPHKFHGSTNTWGDSVWTIMSGPLRGFTVPGTRPTCAGGVFAHRSALLWRRFHETLLTNTSSTAHAPYVIPFPENSCQSVFGQVRGQGMNKAQVYVKQRKWQPTPARLGDMVESSLESGLGSGSGFKEKKKQASNMESNNQLAKRHLLLERREREVHLYRLMTTAQRIFASCTHRRDFPANGTFMAA